MGNPFSLLFGTNPASFIQRNLMETEILKSIQTGGEAQVCILTGVRGVGKTISLTRCADHFRRQKDWIVIDLNVYRDMFLAALGFFQQKNAPGFHMHDISLNLPVVSIGIDNKASHEAFDYAQTLETILERLTKEEKHVLFTIDEVSPTDHVIAFASQFEIWRRHNLNVYLLMAGLYENVSDLQNEKSMTFLYRAPKLFLTGLNLKQIELMYQKHLSVTSETAKEMARTTLGYPYAYQALGYLCYRDNIPWQQALPELDAILEESVYEKLWMELSQKDKEVMASFYDEKKIKVEEIRKRCHMTSSQFSTYKRRLTQKGLIQSPEYGYLQISLPRFIEFVQNHFEE